MWIRKIRNYQFPRHSRTETLMHSWWNDNWYQFSSVAQSCPTLCKPMDCSTPGFLVHHQLPDLAQTHVHRVSDAMQPSPPLCPFPHAFNLSLHQDPFQWVTSSHQVAKILEAFSISPSDEYSGLISFRIDWFDLLAFQEVIGISILKHFDSKEQSLRKQSLLV